MKTDLVEIYSDASNAAVMRHPVLVDRLDELLAHYKTVLQEHQIALPFRD